MNSDDLLLSVAVVAVVVSLLGMGMTYYSIDSFKKTWLTGFATATVNLTVESNLAINFTTDLIEFGSGQVDPGISNATLDTAAGTVTNGNWTEVTQGFVLENIGNVDCNLSFKTGKTAGNFIGGASAGGPQYKWNATNSEAGSCVNSSATALAVWNDWNTTGTGTKICNIFYANNTKDTIRIDIFLLIPEDSKTGVLTDTVTATAST
jgi:hypothetical protein